MLKSVDRFADWIGFLVFEDHHVGPGRQDAHPTSVAVRIATAVALATAVTLMTILLVLGLDAVLDLTPFSTLGL